MTHSHNIDFLPVPLRGHTQSVAYMHTNTRTVPRSMLLLLLTLFFPKISSKSTSLRLRASSCRFTLFLLFARALPLPEMNNTEISVTVFLLLLLVFLFTPCSSRPDPTTRVRRSRRAVLCLVSPARFRLFLPLRDGTLLLACTVLVAQLCVSSLGVCVSLVNALGSVLLLSNECFFFGR